MERVEGKEEGREANTVAYVPRMPLPEDILVVTGLFLLHSKHQESVHRGSPSCLIHIGMQQRQQQLGWLARSIVSYTTIIYLLTAICRSRPGTIPAAAARVIGKADIINEGHKCPK